MQLPTIDRNAVRPAGSEAYAPSATQHASVSAAAEVTGTSATPPGVVNSIDPAVQLQAGSEASPNLGATTGSDVSQGDPSKAGATDKSAANNGQAPHKNEVPPQKTMTQVLVDNLQAAWTASGRVVELWMQNNPNQNANASNQLQSQAQVSNRVIDPTAVPGHIGKQVLTYSPTEIKKTGQVG